MSETRKDLIHAGTNQHTPFNSIPRNIPKHHLLTKDLKSFLGDDSLWSLRMNGHWGLSKSHKCDIFTLHPSAFWAISEVSLTRMRQLYQLHWSLTHVLNMFSGCFNAFAGRLRSEFVDVWSVFQSISWWAESLNPIDVAISVAIMIIIIINHPPTYHKYPWVVLVHHSQSWVDASGRLDLTATEAVACPLPHLSQKILGHKWNWK